MKLERRGKSANARRAMGIDPIAETFGFDNEGGSGWHFERPVETKKEREAFERLCAQLYAKRWAAQAHARNPMRNAERLRVWKQRNPEKYRAAVERALAKRRRGSRTETCRVCGAKYQTTKLSRQCSKKCANRWHGKLRQPKRNRGIRNRSLAPSIVEVLARQPWLSLNELAAALAEGARGKVSPRGSVATALTNLVDAGRVQHDGSKIRRRYAIAGAAREAA